MDKTPGYNSWKAMMRRCYDKNFQSYKNYGAKGIIVEKSWHSFVNFHKDMGDRPDGLTLDRIDPNLNYSAENCKWSDWFEQNNNKRNSNELSGVDYHKYKKKWRARVSVRGDRILVGYFDDKKEAYYAISVYKKVNVI